MPIGNLTSQIFANIYLNEFDQFVLHDLKPLGYVRYGDDFVLWMPGEAEARIAQIVGTQFLGDELSLKTNAKHDTVQPTIHKLAYLGVELWPADKRLSKSVQARITNKLARHNIASYRSITHQHLPGRYRKRFVWEVLDILD